MLAPFGEALKPPLSEIPDILTRELKALEQRRHQLPRIIQRDVANRLQ